MMVYENLVWVLVLFQICHFAADFTPLSTPWMLRAKEFGKPLHPIAVHALVHAVLMSSVTLFFCDTRKVLFIFLFQFLSHFAIDIWKGQMNAHFTIFRDMKSSPFWILTGFDQLLHQLTIVAMLYYLFA